ncbi:acetyl-CoA carboxylase [Loigolactobacillus iwatensis]|uniref:acetyl-CoA carboxylase n=1 Tax=Loigolactobacillus iwatensis TaxID=1267156 RepID=UPI000F7DFD93|nr:acetyl-CoA carboxylase [Loigolactobacillus iwatensis]
MNDQILKREAKLIVQRCQDQFKQRRQTRYWIKVVNDRYDQTYNFFFNYQRLHQVERSVPVRTITEFDLHRLELLIQEIKRLTEFNIEYEGFYHFLWPSSQRQIQKRGNQVE